MIQPDVLDFIDKPINPDTPRLFTVISTFAGCGGSSLGYKWAGGKVLAAVEWEQNAVDTYRLNHRDTLVMHRDIATVTAQEFFDLCGIKPGELDIFDGSPPCQGFSTAGKRQIDDPRNSLFREYVRLLKDLQPKVMVMENVSGMVKGSMKLVFAEILQELKACGYTVKAWLLNAKYFGVPQSRERIVFIGIRSDLGFVPTPPESRKHIITPRVALIDCDISDAPELADWLKLAAKEMVAGNYSAQPIEKIFLKYKGKSGGAMNTKLLSWDRCSCTLVKSEIAGTGIIHPSRVRYLSTHEMKRLTSLPDAFLFTDRKNAVARMGNTVPPMLMQAIAGHIYRTILLPSQTAALQLTD